MAEKYRAVKIEQSFKKLVSLKMSRRPITVEESGQTTGEDCAEAMKKQAFRHSCQSTAAMKVFTTNQRHPADTR